MAYIGNRQILNVDVTGLVNIDNEPSATSKNPLQNAVISQNVSNAIRNMASGSVVFLTDISPIEHILSVKARSYNSFDGELGQGYIDSSGNIVNAPNNVYSVNIIPVQNIYPYTLSATLHSTYQRYQIALSYYKDGVFVEREKRNGEALTHTFTIPKGIDGIRFAITSDNVTTDLVSNCQLQLGTEATPYTPYVDVSTAKVNKYGGNLLPTERGGFTFTTFFELNIYDILSNLIGETITVSYEAKLDTLVSDQNRILNYAYQKQGITINTEHSFVPTAEWQRFSFTTTVVNLGIQDETLSKGSISFYDPDGSNTYSIRNVQISLGEETLEYETYTEPTTYSINADGTVEGVTSLYPTTTLISDTEGVVIDVEYNADTKKYIDNIKAELMALILEV